jgi:hypothetical protein
MAAGDDDDGPRADLTACGNTSALRLRQPGINAMSTVAGAVCLLMGFGAAADPELPLWWAATLALALGGLGIWAVVTSCLMAVVVTADHVLVHSYMGWRRVPRSEVLAVRRVSIYLPQAPEYVAPALVVGSRTIRLWPLAVSTFRPRRVRKVDEWGRLLAAELGVTYRGG